MSFPGATITGIMPGKGARRRRGFKSDGDYEDREPQGPHACDCCTFDIDDIDARVTTGTIMARPIHVSAGTWQANVHK